MAENNITINGDVTVNGDINAIPVPERQAVLGNDKTFFELMSFLNDCPEMKEAERSAREMKRSEERMARLKEKLGDDFKYFFSETEGTGEVPGEDADDMDAPDATDGMDGKEGEEPADGVKKEFKSGRHRLSAEGLRSNFRLVAHRDIDGGGYCEAFSNGYGIYDDGNRQTVLWIPDCAENTCYFNPLRDSEREYLSQKSDVDPKLLGESPWYVAVTLGGSDRITWNLERPKSRTTMSDMDRKTAAEESTDDLSCGWVSGSRFDNPENVLIRKETLMELRAVMDLVTREQLEAYHYYYDEGYTEEEIGEILGIDASNVSRRLKRLRGFVKKRMEKNFFEKI